jgi:iron complex outermembrane recepter protein
MDINLKLSRSRLMAQEATTETPETIAAAAEDVVEDAAAQQVVTVTGFRQSIANSIAIKRESDLIVEAVSAEDIGKLPDNSIAESLARLPGLTAQRLFGRAQQLSVRGLGPDFTTALLNGREQVTAGDNRGVEFDQYPSELLGSAVVYKTPDAELLGQGLAGTIDLRTVRPLSYKERKISVGARYEVNDLGALNAGSEDTGYRLSGSYVDQLADGTLGIAFGGTIQSSPTQAERFEAWGYPTEGGNFILGGAKPYVESRELDRTAAFGTLQYEPVGAFSTTIDLFYSKFEDNGILRGIELPLYWGGAPLGARTVSDGFINSGIFGNVRGVVRNDVRSRDADVMSAGWNAKYELNESWALEGDISFSKVERNDIDLETYSGLPRTVATGDNLAFLRTGDGAFVFGSSINYADPNVIQLTDPGGWGQVGFIKEPSTDDQLTALRFAVSKQFDGGIFSSVDFGVNYSEREKTKRSEEAFLDLAGTATAVPIPVAQRLSPTSLSFLGINSMVSYDPQALLASGIYRIRPNTNPDVVTKSWDVQEEVITAYIKGNIASEFADIPVKGNVGVQFIQTTQASQGARVGRDNTGAVRIVNADFGDEYTNVLPSLNLSFDLGDDLALRTGIARTLARARLDQIRASQEFSIDGSNILFPSELTDADTTNNTSGISVANGRVVFNPSGGNPALRPYLADSFDVSLEKYFGGSGYITIAGFYKDLKDFVFDGARTTVDYSSVLNAATLIDPGTGLPITAAQLRALNPGIDTGILSQPENGEGGFIRGIELSTSIPGDLLLGDVFEGFGLLASASFTDSEITPRDETKGIDVPGLSRTVGNVTLFFEQAGFEARVSNRFRSDFLGEVTGFGAGRELRTIKGDAVVDAQIGYKFESGLAEGLSVTLQANNLTDEPFTSIVNGDDRLVRDFQEYGTTYLLGVNYKF